ncbi:MAG: hypothetical protein RR590_04495, partial [Hungatella sp.]
MIDKNKMPIAMGVAFVWFTTQFGGGFASGAQLLSYFVKFGIWALITPIIAQAIGAVFQWYALRYAKNHDTYDYRSFTDSFFGKYKVIFSNLYEIVYLFTICLAPSVAFATGGSTMNQLLGIPYIVCTLIIGVFIFVLAIYGTELVRKAAATLSVLIILGLLVVYVPNIIAQWSTISANISAMAAEPAPAGPAFWRCFVYASFQLASIGLLTQHAKAFTSAKEAATSMIYGFLVNAFVIAMCTLGMIAIALNPELNKVSVPTLLLVQNGVGASVLTPIISLLIILGAVSTAVNMIAGAVERFVHGMEKKETTEVAASKRKMRTLLIALGFVILTFSIAQFGLIPLVNKGYGYLGYLTIFVIVIPFIIRMVG